MVARLSSPGGVKPQWQSVFRGVAVLVLSACSARHGATSPAPVQNRVVVAAEAPLRADAGLDQTADAATVNGQPKEMEAAGDMQPMSQSQPEFQFFEKTIVWSVIGKTCERILFNPSAPLAGTAFIRQQSFAYRISGNQLELLAFYFFMPESGTLQRDCRTVFLIGPDFGTLGGANVYPTESACKAAIGKAVPLDDSPALVRKKCRAIPIPVTTDEERCHPTPNDLPAKPGCITVLRTIPSRNHPSKPVGKPSS